MVAQTFPPWNEEPDNTRARRQREAVVSRLVDEAARKLPTSELVRSWHRELFNGLAPHPDYLGNFRNEHLVPPCLQGYNVIVGTSPGVDYSEVFGEVDKFLEEFRRRVEQLDASWADHEGAYTVDNIDAVVSLAAWAHGE